MASVELRGVDEARQMLAALKGQIPYATSVALNAVGKDVLAAQKAEMRSVFDEPTPYTLNSLFQTGAKKDKLETRTRIKSPKTGEAGQTEERYIGVQIYGGRRKDKASERRLRALGYLPSGYQMVPGAGVTLNKYGNVAGGRVAAIMANLVGGGSKKVAAGTFVVGTVGKTMGIWQVQARKWKPIFIFVKMPGYEPKLNYHKISQDEFKKKWKAAYAAAIDRALATAR